MVIDYRHPAYQMKWRAMAKNQYNGAYFYSKEISKYLIPNIKTTRNWITINIKGFGVDHSIVFIHNNLNPEHYDWLAQYKDLILIVGVPETASKVDHLGKTIYLPLPIDKAFVERFKAPHDRDICYAGRSTKFRGRIVAGDALCDMPREEMLRELAHYKKCYAVGRTAIEAKILGCEILPYDPRFKDPSIWEVFTYEDAIPYLQRKLDEIDSD